MAYGAVPPRMTAKQRDKEEEDWCAQQDAEAFARWEAVKRDKARMKRAVAKAKSMIKGEKENMQEQKDRIQEKITGLTALSKKPSRMK